MAANKQAIFCKQAHIEWSNTGTTANTATDGTGTAPVIFTAGADGSRVERIRFRAKGSNVATVLRLYVNNGSTPATAGNNSLIAEITLPATTLSQVAAMLLQEFPQIGGADQSILPIVLPAGYKLMISIGTAVATGYAVTAIGGDY